MSAYLEQDPKERVQMPLVVGRVPLGGEDHGAGAVRFELRVGPLQERQQFLHHAADVLSVDQSERQLHGTPPDRYIRILEMKTFYIKYLYW